jgi:glycosyltransferase involved in cell wall biosynthesis
MLYESYILTRRLGIVVASMRVCLLVSEIFAWGKYSGYGISARRLGSGLAACGVETYAIVPKRPGQKVKEELDGITIIGYDGWKTLAKDVYREVNADIYHSQEASLATWGALRAMPHRKHVITCMDPWNLNDWWLEFRYDLQGSPHRSLIYPFLWGYYSVTVTGRAVRRANAVCSQAQYLSQKMQNLYHLEKPPISLPNPYSVPRYPIHKAKDPTVCYVARWDPRKRPEIFFELAKKFPNVRFIALGQAHNYKRDEMLRNQYKEIPNLELVGFINPFESDRLQRILDESWIMINVSAREGLPVSYVESAAHRCAILSAIDADGFASRGGYHVKTIDSSSESTELAGHHTGVADFAEGLEWLLENNRWRQRGEAGYQYVINVFDQKKVVEKHISIYNDLMK